MLGGYYLGQIYLGISGSANANSLSVNSSSHQHSVDNIVIAQHHILVVDNTTHGVFSDKIIVSGNHILHVYNTYHDYTSDNVAVTQHHNILVDNSLHKLLSDTILKIINWDELNVFYGLYMPRHSKNGYIEPVEPVELLIYKQKHNRDGTLGNEDISENGIYRPKKIGTGIL